VSFPFYLPSLDVPAPNMPLTPNTGPTSGNEPVPDITGEANPPSVAGGETSSQPNVIGATGPDLIILPQQASSGGGGLTVGTLAILALLGIGGYMLYKKVKG
jgi:hypothetical protein